MKNLLKARIRNKHIMRRVDELGAQIHELKSSIEAERAPKQ